MNTSAWHGIHISDMENRLKMRIARMFRSSFGSCRTRNTSDVVEKAVLIPQNKGDVEFESLKVLSSPKVRTFPSSCKVRCSEKTSEIIHGDSVVRVNDSLPRKKVSERTSASIWGSAVDGWSCPPASPITPLSPFSRCKESGFTDKTKTKTSQTYRRNKKKKKKKGSRVRTRGRELFPFSSSSMDSYDGGSWWYSSDDDDDERKDETDTLFSSRSLSSSSTGSCRRKKQNCQRRTVTLCSERGVLPIPGKVKDSFAVVKESSDPYNDFRTSMLEMIVEKQIFSPSALEILLQCFLSLNSYKHRKIIVEVFTEIWEALFSNWS